MIVVDANVMVMTLANPTSRGDAARSAMLADDNWIAPTHMPLDVLRTLRKAVLSKRLDSTDADAAFGAFDARLAKAAEIAAPSIQVILR